MATATREFYSVASSVRKLVCTLVRQLRGASPTGEETRDVFVAGLHFYAIDQQLEMPREHLKRSLFVPHFDAVNRVGLACARVAQYVNRSRISSQECLRLPTTSTITPAATAAAPRTGGSGILFCRSAVASIGPTSTIVSRVV